MYFLHKFYDAIVLNEVSGATVHVLNIRNEIMLHNSRLLGAHTCIHGNITCVICSTYVFVYGSVCILMYAW